MVYTRHGGKFTGTVALRLSGGHRQDDNRREASGHRSDSDVYSYTGYVLH